VYPLAFGLPLVWAGFQRSESRTFRWWTAYALGFVAFAYFRQRADESGFPVRWAYPIAFDTLGGLIPLPAAWLQSHAGANGIAWLAIIVHLSYYAVPPIAGIYVWRKYDDLPRYAAALLYVYAIGLVIHILLPTVPPWLAAEHGQVTGVRRLLFVYLYPDLYRYGVSVAGGNDVAAMPSVHMAAATVIASALQKTSWRWVAVLYAAMMGVSLAYLGEHYLVDVLAGALVAIFAWWAAGKLGESSGNGFFPAPSPRSQARDQPVA
jgi:membrane-associated phospholipid phosphatase